MTPPTKRDAELIELSAKLEKLISADPQFTKGDEATIHEMLQSYRGFLAVGKFSKFIIFSLAAIAASIAAYKTIITAVRSWLIG